MAQQIAHDMQGEVARTQDVLTEKGITFAELYLSDTLLEGLRKAGFQIPSPIQIKAIPLGTFGLDLIMQAKSGTGKTLVFGIIALEMVDVAVNGVQAVIVAPTREVAVQINGVIKSIGREIEGLKVYSFIGGLSLDDDLANVQQCHIAVGTPGRIAHLIRDGYLNVAHVRLFVLDEADKLIQTNHAQIDAIHRSLPARKQTIAASATYTPQLRDTIATYLQAPSYVTPETCTPTLIGLRQFVLVVAAPPAAHHTQLQFNAKVRELRRILTVTRFNQCIVFTNYQLSAESVSATLNKHGWHTKYISAAQTQNERLAAIASLTGCDCRILCSTDLTARGIDAAHVDLVVNFDVPHDAATYLHRMGRAGRFGTRGICVTLMFEGGAHARQLAALLAQIGAADLFAFDPEASAANLMDVDATNLKRYDLSVGAGAEAAVDVAADEEPAVAATESETETGDKANVKRKSDVDEEKEEEAVNDEAEEEEKLPSDVKKRKRSPPFDTLNMDEADGGDEGGGDVDGDEHETKKRNVVIGGLLRAPHIEGESVCGDYAQQLVADRLPVGDIRLFFKSVNATDLLVNIVSYTQLWCEFANSKRSPVERRSAINLPIFVVGYVNVVVDEMGATTPPNDLLEPDEAQPPVHEEQQQEEQQPPDVDVTPNDESNVIIVEDDDEEEVGGSEMSAADGALSDDEVAEGAGAAAKVDNRRAHQWDDHHLFDHYAPYNYDPYYRARAHRDNVPHDTFDDLLQFEMNCRHALDLNALLYQAQAPPFDECFPPLGGEDPNDDDDYLRALVYGRGADGDDDDDDVEIVENAQPHLLRPFNHAPNDVDTESNGSDVVFVPPNAHVPYPMINDAIDLTSEPDQGGATLANNPTLTSYFGHYSELLRNNALTFADLDTFDIYYHQWQGHVEAVRNYIQHNMYLNSMHYH